MADDVPAAGVRAITLQFAACYETFANAVAADPLDPAPRWAIAAVTWIEILFAQGVATFEAFTGEISKTDVVRPPAPPLLASRFHRTIEAARALANQQLARADEADAEYQVGATTTLSGMAIFGSSMKAARTTSSRPIAS